MEGLKRADKLSDRGLGMVLDCPLCKNGLETHKHLFFECSYSLKILQFVLLNGNFILLPVNLMLVFYIINQQDHIVLRNLSALTVAISIYKIWGERNARLHDKAPKSTQCLSAEIKRVVAFKLRRWKTNSKWPDYVSLEMLKWRSYSYDNG